MNQLKFDPLDYEDAGHSSEDARKLALQDRNAKLKEVKKTDKRAYGSSLRGQLRKYKSFGVTDGRIRTVYYIHLGMWS